jgi:hypothetical protein
MAEDRAHNPARQPKLGLKDIGLNDIGLTNEKPEDVFHSEQKYKETYNEPTSKPSLNRSSNKKLPVSPHSCARCGAGDHPTGECV